MPHFYFDVRDHHGLITDDEGADFRCLNDALFEAKASARDIAHQCISNNVPVSSSCVEVRDDRGQVVAALTVAEVLAHPMHPEFKNRCSDFPHRDHR